jgi:hypothetical protein
MTPHKEWSYEYERYKGGDSFLGDELITKIVKQREVHLILQNGRSRALLGVLHILSFARNMISINKMSDAGVHTLFQKDTCKMGKGVMVLMKIVNIETLYKLLGSVNSIG